MVIHQFEPAKENSSTAFFSLVRFWTAERSYCEGKFSQFSYLFYRPNNELIVKTSDALGERRLPQRPRADPSIVCSSTAENPHMSGCIYKSITSMHELKHGPLTVPVNQQSLP